MSFSIVMLTWNNMEKFYRCIHTMFYYLTCDDIKEIIILDNGSHEQELLDYLKRLQENMEKVNVIFSNKNLGIGAGRKRLFDMASGEYIISVDSDVVIINPPLLLKGIRSALDIEDMYMVGGGGGDHPYFPTIEKEHIINKPTPKEGTVTVVDEVAGWFTAFKSKHLVKNGGQLYMDEQFSPFWAEDSDFSIQIKHLGKKSCIIGAGLIAHAWSSSHKEETMITVNEMWEKLRNKWYKNMPEFKIIKVDEEFQKIYYNKNEFISTNWMVKGIMENRLPNKEFILKLHPDIKFDDETKSVEYEQKSTELSKFVSDIKPSTILDNLVKLKEDKLSKCKVLTFLTIFNEEDGLRILESCESVHDINLVVILKDTFSHTRVLSKIKQLTNNYRIYVVEHLNHEFKLITNMLSRFKQFEFEKCLILTSNTKSEFIDNLDLDLDYYSNDLHADMYGIELITDVLKIEKEFIYSENGNLLVTKNKLYDIIESLPYQKILQKTVMYEDDVPVNVLPRVSPEHSLIRLFGYMKDYVKKNTLMILICELNEESQLSEIRSLIDHFKVRDVEIMLINRGTLQNIKMSYLKLDYYYNINTEDDKFIIWLKILSTQKIQDYNNIIFSTNDYELDENDNIGHFMDISKYKSIGYMMNEDRLNSVLFSICSGDLQAFNSIVMSAHEELSKDSSFDFTKIIETELLKLNMKIIVNM